MINIIELTLFIQLAEARYQLFLQRWNKEFGDISSIEPIGEFVNYAEICSWVGGEIADIAVAIKAHELGLGYVVE